MAINLTVSLNDAEQARLVEIAQLVQPGATPAQIKTWAERTAKEKLRDEVLQQWRRIRAEEEYAVRQAQESAIVEDWPTT